MKKHAELTRLLDYMEEHIDLDHLREIEQLQYDAINYKEIKRLPLTINTNPEGFERWPADEVYDNPEKMLYNEILWSTMHSSYNSVRIKDDCPLMIRADYGQGIIASMFGCKIPQCNKKGLSVEPIGIDEARRVFAKGIPDVKTALGKRVIETCQYYHERMQSYPKCYKAIHITQPDIQGPLHILRLVAGDEICSLSTESPEMMREMVSIAARTYIQFRRELDPLLTDHLYDAVFVHGCCCGGRVLVHADGAGEQLPEDPCQQFSTEASKYILFAFKGQGGGSLRYTEAYRDWHNELTNSEYLRCVYYEHPALYDLKACYQNLKARNIAIVGWGNGSSFEQMRQTVETGDDGKPILTGLTAICRSNDWKDGIDIMKRHQALCDADRGCRA